jgi:hypothetical protein
MAERASSDEALARFASGLLQPGAEPLDLFKGEAERSGPRFALYRGNLTANWERSLGNAYPVLKQLVGEEFFLGLAREYGRRFGSPSGNLNAFGAQLPRFLAEFPPARPYPYFPDVARLEWAVHTAFYSADSVVLTAADLIRLGAEAIELAPVGLRPGHALLASPWSIADVWNAHQSPPGCPLPQDLARPCKALVYRPAWRVQVRHLGPGEWVALARLAEETTLASALEAGMDADPEFDPGAALPAWLAEGLLTAIDKDQP